MINVNNVLIVEHEGLLVGVLKDAFARLNTKRNHFKLNIVKNCNDANSIIDSLKTIDLALINVNIPPSENDNPIFIEDVGVKLRFTFPKVKIILFSSYKNNIYINSLLKILNPDCLLVKSDINFNELLNAIETVTMEAPYYSKTVIRYMRQRIVSKIIIDQTDKAILYYLSKGIKIKDLPRFINLSKSTIELRKRKLKDVFEVEDQGDYHLLQQASEQGFI